MAPSDRRLPADIDATAFDALHDDLPAWRCAIQAIAARLGDRSVLQVSEGTVLVALLGDSHVLKLYPPFLRDHFDFEAAALAALGGRLSLPTPTLLQTGEHHGWPWLLMTQLTGQPLTSAWPAMTEAHKRGLLSRLGNLAAEVHAWPVAALVSHAPAWPDFVAGQRVRCKARQQRTGLPVHLLGQLEDFLEGPLPQGPDVILTGEYTPMNLLAQHGQLAGMFDFGDGLVGPREYDWLGPLAFLAAGHSKRCRAFFDGCGASVNDAQKLGLMRLLLLHRYSNLNAQIAFPGWQQAPSFEALTALLWE